MKKYFAKTKKQKNLKGFSLVEALVAVLIFGLAMTLVSGGFARFLRNYASAKKMQRDIENAQFAMNIMSKTIRTSALDPTSATTPVTAFPLNVFDYSQSKCIQYSLTGAAGQKKLQIATTKDTTAAKFADCNFAAANLNTPSDLTNNDVVSASINGVGTSAAGVLGRVTIGLLVKEPGQTGNGIPIEMTVSLRQ